MPYGGPRFEFFTQNQYANHSAFILKEDATRAAAIREHESTAAEARRTKSRAAELRVAQEAQRSADEATAQQAAADLRQRRLRAERQQAALTRARHQQSNRHSASVGFGSDGGEKGRSSAGHAHVGGPTRFTGSQRLLALSQPWRAGRPVFGGAAEEKRAGPCCMPGIDRNRYVPPRPDPTFKPWEGSYSTQRAAARQRAAMRAALAAAEPLVDPETRAARQVLWDTLEAEHAARRAACSPGGGSDSAEDGACAPYASVGPAGELSPPPSPSSEAPSVFSHADSTGPIVATGTMHMMADPRAGREQVSLHLSRYGGAMTASSMASAKGSNRRAQSFEEGMAQRRRVLEALSLPELTRRVIVTQRMKN